MDFEIGQTAGVYEFVGVLDHNPRIGRAFKVRNTLAERFEVLRVLPKDVQLDREAVDRFMREIKVHARLSHPNIVAFYTTAEMSGELVMTSEFFDGVTLEKRLEGGAMPLQEAIVCISQVLSALSYAHELGVVHREISPANILLGSDGTVKLTGFGLAKSDNDPSLTRAGTVMGWLEYMSPEQVNGAVKLDGRSDIYSAGAVLYEMVTGQVPFVCTSQFDLMMAHVNKQPEVPAGLGAGLAQVLLTALAKNPSDRFQTARLFRDALESVVVIPSAAELDPIADEPPPRGEEWGLRRLLLTGVLTFIVMVVVFLAFLKISKL